MVSVRFLRHHAPYNGGELAGFPEAEATRLLQMKVVEIVEPPKVAEVASPDLPSGADLDAVVSEQQIKARTRGARR